jgi:hypothetical protein
MPTTAPTTTPTTTPTRRTTPPGAPAVIPPDPDRIRQPDQVPSTPCQPRYALENLHTA